MKDIIYVILFLASCNKKAFSRRLETAEGDNAVTNAESEFFKTVSIRTRGIPDNYPRGSIDYDDEEEDSHRVIFPESDWRLHRTSTSPPQTKIRQCITSCKPVADHQPVCGTDGVTYFNLDQLLCYMKCGSDVNIRRLSPCPGWAGTTNDVTVTTPGNEDFESCFSSCPTTPEYNPVCGTDNVTYKNHGKLTCAQFCGTDVKLSRRAKCPKVLPSTEEPILTSTTPKSTTLSSAVRSCIWSCPSTSEYSPVCGSNKQTYFNLSKLRCASYCGVDVSLLKSSRCDPETTESNDVSEVTATTQKTNKKDVIKYDIDIRFPE